MTINMWIFVTSCHMSVWQNWVFLYLFQVIEVQIYRFCNLSLSAPATAHTHTHVRLTALFSGTTRVSRYQKGKTNLDFIEARESEWQWHKLGHMQVCISLQTDNHASTCHSNCVKYCILWYCSRDYTVIQLSRYDYILVKVCSLQIVFFIIFQETGCIARVYYVIFYYL